MSNNKVYCSQIYRSIVEDLTEDKTEQKTFAAGFVAGLAEKVYLGACTAAMIRPEEKNYHASMRLVGYITAKYGLVMFCLEHEIWMARPSGASELSLLHAMFYEGRKNCPAWHRLRAKLCGIPTGEIDEEFHKRYEGEAAEAEETALPSALVEDVDESADDNGIDTKE